MGFEVDILEREENYKRRVNRMLTLIVVTVGLAVGVGFFMLDRQEKATLKAEATAEESKRLAEIAALRAAYSADSSGAINRFTAFMDKYKAEKVQGAPLFLIKLPASKSPAGFLEKVWDDYANTVEPEIIDADKMDLYRVSYIDAMNQMWPNSAGRLVWQGEHRPNSVVLPEFKFKFTSVEMMKTTFPQVARAQGLAGIRVIETEEDDAETVPADSDSSATAGLDNTAAAP